MYADKSFISNMLMHSAALLKENCGYLSEIDSRFGDGDHGITIKKIATAIETAIADWQDASIHDFFSDLGMSIMAVNGGSAGPLYGTMIGGFAEALGVESQIDAPLFKKMFESCRSEMQDITTAKVGDKTMMDALLPAVDAALCAPDDIPQILIAAAAAAQKGAKDSEQYISKFGRAKSYKEQTIGTPDAGAVSTALFFQGLAEAVEK